MGVGSATQVGRSAVVLTTAGATARSGRSSLDLSDSVILSAELSEGGRAFVGAHVAKWGSPYSPRSQLVRIRNKSMAMAKESLANRTFDPGWWVQFTGT